MDARSSHRSRVGAWQIRRGRDYRLSARFQRRARTLQESRAQATLAALKSRLALTASVQRDGAWKTVPAAEMVPGDAMKLSLGARRCGGREAHRRRSSARSVHAHRQIRAYRSRRGGPNLRRGAGSARRGGGGGHGDRRAHQIRPHRRTRSHRPRREHSTDGRSARGAQSRRFQRRRHRAAGGLLPGTSRCRSPTSQPSC